MTKYFRGVGVLYNLKLGTESAIFMFRRNLIAHLILCVNCIWKKYIQGIVCKKNIPAWLSMFQESFYDKNKHPMKDFLSLDRIYRFPLSLPIYVISMVVSESAKYGRLIVAAASGCVVQLGAVQTVVIQPERNGKC